MTGGGGFAKVPTRAENRDEAADGAKNLFCDIRSSSAEPKDTDPEGMRKDRKLVLAI